MELEAQQPRHADRHRGVAAGVKPAPTVNPILSLLPPRRLRLGLTPRHLFGRQRGA